MQRLPCIWCAASSAAGQRSAACLRSNLRRCLRLRSNPAAVCVLHAGGSAINAQLAPSSGISAASAVYLVRCIISNGSEVSRLSASVCGLGAASWMKCHQCPSSTLQRHQFSVCRASGALHHHQQVSGQPLACICLRSNSAAVHPSAVCVLHAEGNAINVHLTPSSGISSASAVHLVRCIISSRATVSRLPAVESGGGASVCGLCSALLDEVPSMPS